MAETVLVCVTGQQSSRRLIHRGAEIAREIMKRLKASNRDRDYVVNAVKYHDVQIEPTEKAVRKLIAKHRADFAKDLISLKRADNRRQNTRLYDRTEYYDRRENHGRNLCTRSSSYPA